MEARHIGHYPKGSVVFREGDPAGKLYILREGAVELTKRGAHGQILIRTIASENEFFGEMALIDGRPRSATATALEDSALVEADAAAFDRMLGEPLFAAKVVRVLSERMRRANVHLSEVGDLRGRGRLVRAVVDFAERHGEQASLAARYVEIERLVEWLHGHVGLGRDTVMGELDELIRDGVLAYAKVGGRLDEYLLVTGDFIRENERRMDEQRWDPAGDIGIRSRPPAGGARYSGRTVLARGDCSGDLCRFRPGSLVFHEGELGEEMFILVSGRVELTKASAKGSFLMKQVSAPNDFFGEMALIDGKPRSTTARAAEETCLRVVGRESFDRMLETAPSFARRIVLALVERIRATNFNLAEISDTPPQERIARALADYALRFGDAAGEAARYVGLPALRTWMNGHIGVLPEEVDAAVARGLEESGFARSGVHPDSAEMIIVPESYIAAWDRRGETAPAG